MSLEIVIEVEGVDPAKYAEMLMDYVGSAPVQEAAARGAANVVEDHFVELDKKGNKLGGKRTHYWGEARNSVNVFSDADGGRVNISKTGVALHYYGGTVVPVEQKALTIPARAEYHGYRAREFDLRFVPAWGGSNGNLVGTLVDEEGAVAYWLVKKTVHAPNADVLPAQDAMVEAASKNIVALVKRFRPPPPQKEVSHGS